MKYSGISYFYHVKAQASISKRLTLPDFDGEDENNGATVEVISNKPRDRRSISTPEPVHDDDDTPLDQLQKGSLPDLVKNIQEKSTPKPPPVVQPVPSKPPSAVPTVSPKPAEALSKPTKVSEPIQRPHIIPLPYPPKPTQAPKPTEVPTKPLEPAPDKQVCDTVPDLALKEELTSKPPSPPETEDNDDDSDSDDSDIGIPDDLNTDTSANELPIPDSIVDSEATKAAIEKAEKVKREAEKAEKNSRDDEKLKQFCISQKSKSTEGTPKKTERLESPHEDRKNAKKEASKERRINELLQKLKDEKNKKEREKAAESKEKFEAEQAKLEAQKKAEAKKQADQAKDARRKAEADKKAEANRRKAAKKAQEKWKKEFTEEFMEKYLIQPVTKEMMKENRTKIVDELFDREENGGLSFIEQAQIEILFKTRKADTSKIEEMKFQTAKEGFIFS